MKWKEIENEKDCTQKIVLLFVGNQIRIEHFVQLDPDLI